jgi:DNA-binding HxlR family transcriptional regulator
MAIDFLIEKTERTVETAFLWLRTLRVLKRKPCFASELRRLLNPMPHRNTFEASLFLLARLGLVKREKNIYEITPKGEKVLNRATAHLKRQMAVLFEP